MRSSFPLPWPRRRSRQAGGTSDHRRGLAGLLALLVTLICLVPATAARADDKTPSEWRIKEYVVKADVDRDGDANVTVDMAFDFANHSGHGPYLTFTERQGLTDDPDHWRRLSFTGFRATSSTGADATVKTERNEGAVLVRLGRNGRTFTGVQRYTLSFTVHGLISLNNEKSHLDEVNWRVFDNFDVPMDAVKVTLTGPADATRTACYTSGRTCSASADGRTITYSVGSVARRKPVQAVAGYPAGTFTSKAAPTLTKRYHLGNTFGLSAATGAGTVGTGLLAVVAVLWSLRRMGRDEEFAGVAPGVVPPEGQRTTRRRVREPEVAVSFRPPQGMSPAEAGVIVDGSADNGDVTAGILDLAVRGHLVITPVGQDRKGRTEDWEFTRRPECTEPLRPWESELLDAFFESGSTQSTAHLRKTKDLDILGPTRTRLDALTHERGWYKRQPSMLRALSVLRAVGVLALAAIVTVACAFAGWGLVAVPIVLGALVYAALAVLRSPGRTALGTAANDQVRSFRKYLTTAEADQIRFEEGIDVFSRYLPWAVIFGVTERWVKVFQDLQARGVYEPDYSWYGGYWTGYAMGDLGGFASSMDTMTSAMTSSLESAATSSTSSSGSGFSGGGGFGGGGGGGW